MKESGYYPEGAEFDPRAPYNQTDLNAKEIDVLVSLTISKPFKVKVNDYSSEYDEESGNTYYDFSACDLKEAINDQIILPQDAYKYQLLKTKIYEDLKDWNVDDFEVLLE